jgi:hypothetical protein
MRPPTSDQPNKYRAGVIVVTSRSTSGSTALNAQILDKVARSGLGNVFNSVSSHGRPCTPTVPDGPMPGCGFPELAERS